MKSKLIPALIISVLLITIALGVATYTPFIEDDKAAFGELITAELTPKVQIDFPYNINTDIVNTTTTGSGTVTQSNGKVVVQTTASASSTAQLTSKRVLKYDAGQGALIRFTAIFTTGVASSTQIVGIGDNIDGFFFGYNATSSGILRRQNGVDIWTAQTSWSEDLADGTGTLPSIDWTKGNVFQIRYQWLGFGLISFWMENPSTGKFVRVHNIEYANANTEPSIFNPSLPLCIWAKNTSNSSNIKIESSSMAGFVEGKEVLLGPKNSISNAKAAIDTTETNIITIRNRDTFVSSTNRVEVELDFIAIAVDGTKPAIARVTKNTTLGGAPVYVRLATSTSVIEYDTAGTTLTGGEVLFTFSLAKEDSNDLKVNDLHIDLVPGDTLTLSVEATSGSTDTLASFSWIERF